MPQQTLTIKTKIFVAMAVLLILPMFFKAIYDYNHQVDDVTQRVKKQMQTIITISTVTNQNFMWSRAAVRDRLGKHFYDLPKAAQNRIIEVGADGLDATMALLNQKLDDTRIWYTWGDKIHKYVKSRKDIAYRQLPKDSIDHQVLQTGESFYGVTNWDGNESMYKKGTQVFRASFAVRIIDKKNIKFRDREIEYIDACASCHINDMGISPMEPMAVVSASFDMEPALAAAKMKLIKSLVIYLIINLVTLGVLLTILQKMVFSPINELEERFQDIGRAHV